MPSGAKTGSCGKGGNLGLAGLDEKFGFVLDGTSPENRTRAIHIRLTFTILRENSVDNKKYYSCFCMKIGFDISCILSSYDISCKLSPKETIFIKGQILFS